MQYKDKVIWITGASSGIGEALALALAQQGARLILSARRQAELERVATQTQLPAERVLVLPLDLADASNLVRQAQAAWHHWGRIDIVIHNAGISQRALATDTTMDVVRQLMQVNYFGTVALTQALLPYLRPLRQGHFVVVTSAVGIIGSPLRSAYAASKHALHGYFDSLRAELWQDNIRISIVCPGFIRTPLPLVALRGDGSPQGKMDDAQTHGMPAPVFARKMLRAVASGAEEVYIGGWREVLAIYLKRYWPSLFSRILRRARVT